MGRITLVTLALALALALAACTQPTSAQADSARDDVLRLLTELGQGAPLDRDLVERQLRVKLAPRGTDLHGKRALAHGALSASVYGQEATITLPGQLPGTPCVVAIGELLDHAKAQGFEVSFNEVTGRKSSWTLTKEVAGVGLMVMANPPATSKDERAACVGYISAGKEANDGQAVR